MCSNATLVQTTECNGITKTLLRTAMADLYGHFHTLACDLLTFKNATYLNKNVYLGLHELYIRIYIFINNNIDYCI